MYYIQCLYITNLNTEICLDFVPEVLIYEYRYTCIDDVPLKVLQTGVAQSELPFGMSTGVGWSLFG